jgi:FMN-dependent NADH-azoreductase
MNENDKLFNELIKDGKDFKEALGLTDEKVYELLNRRDKNIDELLDSDICIESMLNFNNRKKIKEYFDKHYKETEEEKNI